MKQPETTKPFTTDTPLIKGRIYLIQQETVKKVVSIGTVGKLTGNWKILKSFEA